MSAVVELKTPIHLYTPLGYATAYFMSTTGWDGTEWGCFQRDTGEFWWWPNKEVRLPKSITERRYRVTPITMQPGGEEALAPHKARAKVNDAPAVHTTWPSIMPASDHPEEPPHIPRSPERAPR